MRRERRLLDGGLIGVWHMAGGRRAGAELDLGGLTARCRAALGTTGSRTGGPSFFATAAVFCKGEGHLRYDLLVQ